jgi:hypothetical protein
MKPMKPVRRIYELGERRPTVVTFYPDGIVEFREKGRRKVYAAHLKALWLRAVRNAVEDEKAAKKAERAAKRAARS